MKEVYRDPVSVLLGLAMPVCFADTFFLYPQKSTTGYLFPTNAYTRNYYFLFCIFDYVFSNNYCLRIGRQLY